MKKKTIITVILFVLFFCVHSGFAQPEIRIDQSVFTFESVPEGVHISHEFVIKNTGNTLLHINNVLPP